MSYRPIVFVDANVWYSRTLRDWIGLLYTSSEARAPFDVKWTEDVLAEVVYHLRKKHPDWEGAKIAAVRKHVAGIYETGRVTDFKIDDAYPVKDSGDAHVHAAAVACRADVLLTLNVGDFRWNDADSPYEVMTPDEFLVWVDDNTPESVITAAASMCRYWYARRTEFNLAERLKKAGCPLFAARVTAHLLAAPTILSALGPVAATPPKSG